MTFKTYPLKLSENVNLEVKIQAAKDRMSMQAWIAKAIEEKLEKEV